MRELSPSTLREDFAQPKAHWWPTYTVHLISLRYPLIYKLSPTSALPSAIPRPFGECDDLPPKEILRRVFYCPEGSKGFRPNLEGLECPDAVKGCLRDCWREVPEMRPDFKSVRGRLRSLRKVMVVRGHPFMTSARRGGWVKRR